MFHLRVHTAAAALIAALYFGLCEVASCAATGFLIYNQHAAANASAVAYTAQVDNPSAVFYNPAALSRLGGTQASCGGTVIIPRTTFTSDATGSSSRMKHHTYLLPAVYLTHQLNERFSIGLATATGGVFEIADSTQVGGWLVRRRFDLVAIRYP